MTADTLVSAMQAAHIFFNSAMFLALAFQGVLGWRIRNKRLAGRQQDSSIVKRHRALGPVLATLLPLGYLAGLIATNLHKGPWVRYPSHFAVGTVILVVACSAVLVAKRIRGAQSPWRTPHFALGLLLLCAFLVQIYLGLNILL